MQLTLKQKIFFSLLLIGVIFGGIWYFFFQQTSSEESSDISQTPVVALPENNDDIRIRHLILIENALKEAILRNSTLTSSRKCSPGKFWGIIHRLPG
jgi:hypothetical protein